MDNKPALRTIIAAALLSCATPAFAQDLRTPFQQTQAAALKYEIAFLALSAIDTAQTVECISAGRCEEANPLWGKNPGTAKIIASKVAFGALHYVIFDHLNKRNPRLALRVAQISVVGQAGVVMLNARVAF